MTSPREFPFQVLKADEFCVGPRIHLAHAATKYFRKTMVIAHMIPPCHDLAHVTPLCHVLLFSPISSSGNSQARHGFFAFNIPQQGYPSLSSLLLNQCKYLVLLYSLDYLENQAKAPKWSQHLTVLCMPNGYAFVKEKHFKITISLLSSLSFATLPFPSEDALWSAVCPHKTKPRSWQNKTVWLCRVLPEGQAARAESTHPTGR